jgi:hypothetical protein
MLEAVEAGFTHQAHRELAVRGVAVQVLLVVPARLLELQTQGVAVAAHRIHQLLQAVQVVQVS